MRETSLALLAVVILASGCEPNKDKAKGEPAASAAPSASSSSTAAASASASAATAPPQPRPSGPKYPRTGLKLLASDCQKPAVLLPGKGEQNSADISDATSDLGAFVSQLFWANPQFMPVDGEPARAGEVRIMAVSGWQQVDNTADGFRNLLGGSVIAVRCADAETCNDVAALYATIRKWPQPQLHCGELPQFASNTSTVRFVKLQGAQRAPGDKHIVGLCARVAACRYHDKPQLNGKIYQICTSSPVRFKANCGSRLSCEDVMACLGR